MSTSPKVISISVNEIHFWKFFNEDVIGQSWLRLVFVAIKCVFHSQNLVMLLKSMDHVILGQMTYRHENFVGSCSYLGKWLTVMKICGNKKLSNLWFHFSYFREPWCLAIFHDRFKDFRAEVREIFVTEEVGSYFLGNSLENGQGRFH